MTRLLLAATAALALAVSPVLPADAATCVVDGACVCDSPCECDIVCLWLHRPFVGCYQTPDLRVCV